MSSDGDKDRSSDLESRLARLVDGVTALGKSLGEIPERLTQEWLDEQEARWAMETLGESSSMTESSAGAGEMTPEDEEDVSPEPKEHVSPDPEEHVSPDPEEHVSPDPEEGSTDSIEAPVLGNVELSRQSVDSENVSPGKVGPSPSADEAGFGGFVPNRAEWVAFSAYACAGALWAGVLALELVERESVDGIRGVIVLSFVCSIILGFVVRREFHRPKDRSGPQGEIRFLREGLTLAMAGILGTAAGVGVGLGASDTELGVVIGWGASVGSGLGALGMALVLFAAVNGSLRHGGRMRSWPGFGILAAVGTGLLAMGVMHIQEIVGLVDSFADAQDQAEQFLDDAVGDKSDLPKHSADWVTTLAVSPLPDLFRVVLRQLYVFNFAVTALMLGLGTWLSARLMLTAHWPKRLEQAVTASTCVGYGLMWLSAALGLGTLMALDAAFLQVGSGPNEMKNEVTVLLGVLLITAGSGVTSGARHLAAGRRHLKKNL